MPERAFDIASILNCHEYSLSLEAAERKTICHEYSSFLEAEEKKTICHEYYSSREAEEKKTTGVHRRGERRKIIDPLGNVLRSNFKSPAKSDGT